MRVGILEAEENYGVTVVVFADETTAETFEFQDATAEVPYCLVVNGGATVQGGLRHFSRDGNRFCFHLTDRAATSLGVDADIHLIVDSENSGAGTCDRAEAVIVAALSASRREEQVGSEDEQLACQLPRTNASASRTRGSQAS